MGSVETPVSSGPTIPIVDLAPFTSRTSSGSTSGSGSESDQTARAKAARDLVRACREIGFVYIKNHGVPQHELDKAFAISKQFYDLPTEDKMKAPHPPGWKIHRGYSWPGLEKVSSVLGKGDAGGNGDEDVVKKLREVEDFKESYEIGSEDDPEQPNIWPPSDVLPEWRPFMTSFYWTLFTSAQAILRALAIGLNLPSEDHLLPYHSGHSNQLRLLHYPRIPASMISSGKIARIPAHTDWSTITLLFQDDVGGLQVSSKDDPEVFVDVPPIEGTCVVNVGDLLMRWSNDYLTSTMHRVRLPPLQGGPEGDGERDENREEKMTKARYSIPYFVTTDPDTVIECLTGRFEGGEVARYEPITQREYSAMRAKMQY